ncbi:hypothetical protein B0H67DRAFT_234239 [Lasiosphaeris hirsuta]|uniref:Uncharacterized protein n=1 Tax=Lasiosphaeris hirsuta TaxID=260670 RepID=A0AA40AFY4_9PEZI|nr:hypothetical protein B0H67DRAFT_234239 [Lasiosphaeris hirsuta]
MTHLSLATLCSSCRAGPFGPPFLSPSWARLRYQHRDRHFQGNADNLIHNGDLAKTYGIRWTGLVNADSPVVNFTGSSLVDIEAQISATRPGFS